MEWKLAVDRSHLMSAARAFLLPVVVDDTSDTDEHVPDKFRDVQWTRLPGGNTPRHSSRVAHFGGSGQTLAYSEKPDELLQIPGARMPALDGLRGVAIIWVVLHNTTNLLPSELHGPWRALAFLVHPGWIGVQLFFALSGFLITGSLLETRHAQNYFRAFYARRALRILPLYYTVLILLLIVAPAMHVDPPRLHADLSQQLSLWLFAVNWTHAEPYGLGHFWSLAVEEQFYWFWPFIVRRPSLRRLISMCVAIAVIALVARGIMILGGASSEASTRPRPRAWMRSGLAARARASCASQPPRHGSFLDSRR